MLLLALAAATSAPGCNPQPGDPDGTPDSGESDEPTTTAGSGDTASSGAAEVESTGGATETAGETEGGPVVDEGMFACGLASSCGKITWHLEPDDEPDAVRCAAELVVSGEPGVIRAAEVPGPGLWEDEMIVLVDGDGTALMQTRERECSDDLECDLQAQPWQGYSEIRRCEIVISEGLAEDCATEDQDGCAWWPWEHLDCGDVEEPTCEDLQAILDAR